MKKIIIIILIMWVSFTISSVKAEAPDVLLADKPVEQIVEHFFGENTEIMIAIFKAESGLNPTAKNYNCRYGKVSKSCKTKLDREKAWSVDCGIAQINVKGTICPKELLIPIHNLAKASDKLSKEGLTAWSVYNNGSYKKFLD